MKKYKGILVISLTAFICSLILYLITTFVEN